MAATKNAGGTSSIITVFGSSKPAEGDPEYETARAVGRSLAQAGFAVCNGGYGGTMLASATGARDAGGATIGVVTEYFSRIANPAIQKTIVTKSLLDRLEKLMELGEAYVVLRGSTGTLLELAAVWEYMNKRIMSRKPIVLVGSFWSPVIEVLGSELIHEGKRKVTQFISTVGEPDQCGPFLRKMLPLH